MATVRLSGLGGAAAIVNTSPLIRLRPLRQATPLVAGMAKMGLICLLASLNFFKIIAIRNSLLRDLARFDLDLTFI